tara:strand:- start:1525 stop:2484 length:960 start_codon:yes stop_codon:yes gene_type:complete
MDKYNYRKVYNSSMLSADGKTPLIIDGDKAYCSSTKKNFKKDSNVIIFLESEDNFYEGAYLNTVNFSGTSPNYLNKIITWTINSGYLYEIDKNVSPGSSILELGCAGGIKYLGRKYNTYGCDISFQSLKIASKNYEYCALADSTDNLPFLENSFDAVVSSYFWEHLNKEQKIKCLKNISKVLKPGGVIVFLYDVSTLNPLVNFFREKNPRNYQERFLDHDGHIGYEKIKDNIVDFEKNNFSIIYNKGLQKTFFQDPSVYQKFLGVGNLFQNYLLKTILFLSTGRFYKPYLFLLRILDVLFSFLPEAWSRMTITVAKKNK